MVPLAQALLILAAAFAFLSLGVFLARRLRDRTDDDRPVPHNLLTKFREMHGKGELSDEEFRTIKTKLASQFQDELRDTDETG
ncbi:MAG: SHOCT domain-containing protein [Pirellulales bacterium]